MGRRFAPNRKLARARFLEIFSPDTRFPRSSDFRECMHPLYSCRELIRNLVLKDLKLKYRDSVLGFLWSLANPLLLILV
jgi:hypothetical protein